MKPDFSLLAFQFSKPAAIIGETLLLTALAVALGAWSNPADPLWINATFPWIWLAPVVLALRYGPIPGLGGAAALLAAWMLFHFSGWVTGDFPKIHFLGGLILVMLCGEFSSLWLARTRRAESVQRYLEQRLEYLTHQQYLLRLSHDRIEQELIARPMTLRDALGALQSPMAEVTADNKALPGAAELLRLLVQYCQIETASLHNIFRSGLPDPEPAATIGRTSPFDGSDALVRHALQTRTLSHVMSEPQDAAEPQKYLVAAPLVTFDDECLGLLVIEHMPFFALTEETLQALNLLLGYYVDAIVRKRATASILARHPDCPEEFAFELLRASRLAKFSAVESRLVALEIPNRSDLAAFAQQTLRQKRGLDVAWLIERKNIQVLATLMPLCNSAGAEGYIARIDALMLQQRGETLADVGITVHTLALEGDDPAAVLDSLFTACHAS